MQSSEPARGALPFRLPCAARDAARDVLGRWSRRSRRHQHDNENRPYLPGVKLDPAIRATNDLGDVAVADIVLLAAPAQDFRATLEPLAGQLSPSTRSSFARRALSRKRCADERSRLVSVCGEPDHGAVGADFRRGRRAGLPTAVTLAADDIDAAQQVANCLSSERFRPYSSDDVIGAQIGGAIKNVLAIACGIADGCGFGDNARAA